ncbi:bifunctional proline dehydrogenase/L-glutamate gamma-semialdehyde dehydrogenase PutA [Luminiphilus sp. nBUS_16]|uniref:bifunctional proline dehydrogenase/L-glutamate gamma-semialdehyde dehydrogenase PutA n=1 Tax=Luminiphilus sp. nBUS_16 TaxID=3395315 RepID=UPI003EBF33F7
MKELRHSIRAHTNGDETSLVNELLSHDSLDSAKQALISKQATSLVNACRECSHQAGTLDAFLQEFGLSNKEGVALMCLAEALLRVPDEATADQLVGEKIRSGDWGSHQGASSSRFVNASIWGLMLTGRVMALGSEATEDTGSWVQALTRKMGEPVVRRAILQAMKIMGGQYVLGRTIKEAIRKGRAANSPSTRFSFDMLGEGARTASDAQRYFDAYGEAIRVLADANTEVDVTHANGISIKLSALHPRYAFSQYDRVISELLPRLKQLAKMARAGGLSLTIDAEESERLDVSLDLFEALARDPDLYDWDGLGFVLQAYQKRAEATCDWLIAMARETNRRFMVRLVKGAYWDREIKHAQELGLPDYPVFTRKCNTDLSYQICATKLLSAAGAVFPQFATHNAHTVSMIKALAQGNTDFEFQRLHGMGQLLYAQLSKSDASTPIRVYAPVGNHKDLLPYLVRRLLENGANSSFVNRFLDASVSASELNRDPIEQVLAVSQRRHPKIPLPRQLYAQETVPWLNAMGFDLNDASVVRGLFPRLTSLAQRREARPIVGGQSVTSELRPVINPASGETAGYAASTSPEEQDKAIELAVSAQPLWDLRGAHHRAECLERAAELLEAQIPELMGVIVSEAGRTLEDALSEVREAIDFCRYYAQQAREKFTDPIKLPGPTGELNALSLHGRGAFLCISPWNFPLAIFMGQVSAALVAGNAVLAKPAEQTPLIAFEAVKLLHEAGIPEDILHLLPGDKSVGAALVADNRIAGVAFTGSTETAKGINRQLAARDGAIIPLIAETGGINVMLVDATALPEQVVDDVIVSAFQSAGQRCSALRVLYLQEDIADAVIDMLRGATLELRVGDPMELRTDVGPVIDAQAQQLIEEHTNRMRREGRLLSKASLNPDLTNGHFVAPQIYEIDRLDQLEREVFGPILHVIRYKKSELQDVLADIRASSYGLTLGIHSRIDGFAQTVFENTQVGNTYINRNTVGAVVGVNPFGGQGLSGTGPKAGGPHYLYRFVWEKTRTDNVVAKGGNTDLFTLQE